MDTFLVKIHGIEHTVLLTAEHAARIGAKKITPAKPAAAEPKTPAAPVENKARSTPAP